MPCNVNNLDYLAFGIFPFKLSVALASVLQSGVIVSEPRAVIPRTCFLLCTHLHSDIETF